MGEFSSSNIDKRVQDAKDGVGGDGDSKWKLEGTYTCKLTGAKCGQSYKAGTPGMMFVFKVREADHLDKETMEDAFGRELNVNYWHKAGLRMNIFVQLMDALGFDFETIDKFEKDKGREWTKDDWDKQKVFLALEDASPIMDILITPQLDDNDKPKLNDKGYPYWNVDIDIDTVEPIEWGGKKSKSKGKSKDKPKAEDKKDKKKGKKGKKAGKK